MNTTDSNEKKKRFWCFYTRNDEYLNTDYHHYDERRDALFQPITNRQTNTQKKNIQQFSALNIFTQHNLNVGAVYHV